MESKAVYGFWITYYARKSLLFDDSGAWVKKDGNPLFDVTMDSFDGAEVCELVKLYLLNKIKSLLGSNNVGLDRDDGLAIVHKANGPKVDRLRKDIISLFMDEGLSITIDTNLIDTDLLDVSFNLNTGKYFPFRKPNNAPLYIHSKFTNPPSVIKELPSMTNKRISSLSCDETEFNKAKITYEIALKNSGCQATLKFEKTSQNTRRNRNRKVIWFNPPFSLNVKTKIGKEFFKLIRKHFPINRGFRKIFNLNTIKISYSSMKNMKTFIKQHNARVLKNQEYSEKRSCSCRVKDNCLLDGKYLREYIVYQANAVTNNEYKEYFGTAEGEFKLRHNNHTMSFRHKKRVNDTELSKYLWKLKEENADYNLQWSIKAYASPYKCGTRKCDLCLTEKMIIARSDPRKLLNKRTELVSKCRYTNKFLLSNIK